MMFSGVIGDITFPRRSPVFSQSCREDSASLSDVGGVAVGAIDLINRFLSVPRAVPLCVWRLFVTGQVWWWVCGRCGY